MGLSTAAMHEYLAAGEVVLASTEGIGAALSVTTTEVVVTLAAQSGRDPIVRRYSHDDLRDVVVTRPRYGIGWLSLRVGDPGAQAITRVRYRACRLEHVEAAAGLMRERMRPAVAEGRLPAESGILCRSETGRRQRGHRGSGTSVPQAGPRGNISDAIE